MYSCERTITPINVRYKQPRTLGTHAQPELGVSVRTHARCKKYTSTRASSSTREHQPWPRSGCPYRTSTSTHVHCVRRSGCSCQTLYKYKYSAYVQAQALMYTTYAARAVHVIHCTCTRTVGIPKHAGLRTITASLRLSMSNTVHVRVQCARPSMQATYVRSIA